MNIQFNERVSLTSDGRNFVVTHTTEKVSDSPRNKGELVTVSKPYYYPTLQQALTCGILYKELSNSEVQSIKELRELLIQSCQEIHRAIPGAVKVKESRPKLEIEKERFQPEEKFVGSGKNLKPRTRRVRSDKGKPRGPYKK